MNDIKHNNGIEASRIDARLRLMRLADTQLILANPSADVRGHRVMDSNQRKIGYVRGLMVDEATPKVCFLEIAFGGVLGWGESAFLVPVEAVVRVEKNAIFIDQTCQRSLSEVSYQPELQEFQLDSPFQFSEYEYYESHGSSPYGKL
ncbi:PRC-barrel domain containing protein [bacterium]|nr:MAG: PRC-barrel domain containing protein [bacterium]